MGVYGQMMRPSMGHKMQTEQRENNLNYQFARTSLQDQLSSLRFDKTDLYTSPPPPLTPEPSVKSWGKAGSSFSEAPEKAAQRARLAKLEQENSSLSIEATAKAQRHNQLPPLETDDTTLTNTDTNMNMNTTAANTTAANTTTNTTTNNSEAGAEATKEEAEKKNLRFGAETELKTPVPPAAVVDPKKKYGRGFGLKKFKKGQKGAGNKQMVKAGGPMPFKMLLPTIPSVERNTMWDSGQNHVHRMGKALPIERSQVVGECETFRQRTKAFPETPLDTWRKEIKLKPLPAPPALPLKPKVKLHKSQDPLPPPPAQIPEADINIIYTESTPLGVQGGRPQPTMRIMDHFPKTHALLPELDETLSDDDSEIDELDKRGKQDRQLVKSRHPDTASLPVVSLSKVGQREIDENTVTSVPNLYLRDESPSMLSLYTGRSGVTGASYMSTETLSWKAEYIHEGNPDRRNKVLADILSAVHQRMRDNEEDLRLSGRDPRPGTNSGRSYTSRGGDPHSHREDDVFTPASSMGSPTKELLGGLVTTRQNKQKVTARRGKSKAAPLKSYLDKLSTKRRLADQRHVERVRFHLAHIRELTHESLAHHGSVKTSTTVAA